MDQQTREAVIAKLRESGLGDVLYLPGDEKYDVCVASYWSLSPRLHPWAFVQPRNTEEVSMAVKAILSTDDVKFALRGLVFTGIIAAFPPDSPLHHLYVCRWRYQF